MCFYNMHKCMEWRRINFDWNRARAFLVTAEEGSLSAAARALGVTQPTLGRQVAALERELGVVLFERDGRGLTPTQSGMDLAEHVRGMAEAANRVSLSAAGHSEHLAGNIRITAGEAIAAFLLPPVVARLRRAYPGIDIEIVASNRPSDLRKREADIAIRSFRPTEPDLIAKKIRDVPVRLYAAESYLKEFGTALTSDDLSRAEFIGFDRTEALLKALNGLGLTLTDRNFPVVTENHLVGWELVKQGVGIGVMQEDIAALEPGVRLVLPELAPIVIPMWLVAHRELRTSKRVRVVFDLLAAELGNAPERPLQQRN